MTDKRLLDQALQSTLQTELSTKSQVNSQNHPRRHFGKLMAMAIGSISLPSMATEIQKKPHRRMLKAQRLIKPPRLRVGDVVGLIAPSGVADQSILQKSIENIEAMGCKVKLGANVLAARGSFAGTVTQRLDDLHSMFADPEVNAIWAVRGGCGLMSLLPDIRYDLIRKHPKILVGYSDITALHLALIRHVGLVNFHGPVASSTFSDYSLEHLRAVLMEPQAQYTIKMDPEAANKALTAPQYIQRTHHQGVAEGRLMGGNLSLVSALIGTQFAADFTNSIAFLEDVTEAPYRIDRMLTHLRLTEDFRAANGVMLGVFNECEPPANEASLTLEETIADHLDGLSVTAVSGYSFGHIDRQFTLPMGVKARLDSNNNTLTLLEPAVSL